MPAGEAHGTRRVQERSVSHRASASTDGASLPKRKPRVYSLCEGIARPGEDNLGKNGLGFNAPGC